MTEIRSMRGPDAMYDANALESLLPTENALQASRGALPPQLQLHNCSRALTTLHMSFGAELRLS